MVQPAPQRARFLAPGDKLGKYELIRQIAVGGMAELYLARTVGIEGFEKLVVLKRILPQFADNASFVNMFLNEARLAATLHHPNIAQVYDIGQDEGDYFFSMEYVHGEDLGHLVASAADSGVPLSLDAALTLVAGLCAGLHYAHDKVGPDGRPLQVVHRDVSPSNVLVSYDGAVKLVDFGIARAGSNPSTSKGGLKGKIAYMSPEQCRGRVTLDRRSDVFSIGTILYELTTGRVPFTDETEYGILNQIVNQDAEPPSQWVEGYAPALEAIVLRALSRDPDRRYATALEMQKAIEDFAHDNRLRVSPLVLARVMGTLFPTRLEEWDHARAQGAFFVEQHVVRTLIESGKGDEETAISPPPIAPAEADGRDAPTEQVRSLAMQPVAGHPAALAPLPLPPTVVAHPPPAVPVPGTSRLPMPSAARELPIPGHPGAVPIVRASALHAAAEPPPEIPDVTAQVRIRPASVRHQTVLLQSRRSRRPVVIAGVAALVIAAVVGVGVVLSSQDPQPAEPVALPSREPAPAAAVAEPAPPSEPVVVPAPEPAPAAVVAEPAPTPVPAPVAETTPAPAPEPTPVAAPESTVEPAPTPPSIAVGEPAPPAGAGRAKSAAKLRPRPRPARRDVRRPRPPAAAPATAAQPAPPPAAKEPAWSADSPFMPVRPDE